MISLIETNTNIEDSKYFILEDHVGKYYKVSKDFYYEDSYTFAEQVEEVFFNRYLADLGENEDPVALSNFLVEDSETGKLKMLWIKSDDFYLLINPVRKTEQDLFLLKSCIEQIYNVEFVL